MVAWNVTGGDVRISDVGDLAELVGASDPEILLHGLLTMRNLIRARQQNEGGDG